MRCKANRGSGCTRSHRLMGGGRRQQELDELLELHAERAATEEVWRKTWRVVAQQCLESTQSTAEA